MVTPKDATAAAGKELTLEQLRLTNQELIEMQIKGFTFRDIADGQLYKAMMVITEAEDIPVLKEIFTNFQ